MFYFVSYHRPHLPLCTRPVSMGNHMLGLGVKLYHAPGNAMCEVIGDDSQRSGSCFRIICRQHLRKERPFPTTVKFSATHMRFAFTTPVVQTKRVGEWTYFSLNIYHLTSSSRVHENDSFLPS